MAIHKFIKLWVAIDIIFDISWDLISQFHLRLTHYTENVIQKCKCFFCDFQVLDAIDVLQNLRPQIIIIKINYLVEEIVIISNGLSIVSDLNIKWFF